MLPWRTPRPPRDLDAAAIRAAYGYDQASFAALCGVSVGTLRNWEQGRRRPTGPARALLILIASYPEAYAHAIREWQRQQLPPSLPPLPY
jgi:DNA-binding transcriptional regulator YiaG